MHKLKNVKKYLKQHHKWAIYKQKFQHKQMRLIISKILLVYNPQLEINLLCHKEMKMLETNLLDQESMFVSIFNDFNKLTQIRCDWQSFAKMLFYIYQTSTYWQDLKTNKLNIFNQNHYLKNQRKRFLYTEWLKSLNFQKETTNDKVIKILKLVF